MTFFACCEEIRANCSPVSNFCLFAVLCMEEELENDCVLMLILFQMCVSEHVSNLRLSKNALQTQCGRSKRAMIDVAKPLDQSVREALY